jgi:hypothetical protein
MSTNNAWEMIVTLEKAQENGISLVALDCLPVDDGTTTEAAEIGDFVRVMRSVFGVGDQQFEPTSVRFEDRHTTVSHIGPAPRKKSV